MGKPIRSSVAVIWEIIGTMDSLKVYFGHKFNKTDGLDMSLKEMKKLEWQGNLASVVMSRHEKGAAQMGLRRNQERLVCSVWAIQV